MDREYKKLDFSKITFCETPISSKEALKEVEPMHWSKEVLEGKKKVIIQ